MKKVNSWIVSSKNVGILVRDAKDIYKYNGKRFHYAHLIAETWFKIIENFSKEKIEEL